MTESLRDFIVRRRAELDAAEEPLRQQLAEIGKERDQLRRAALAAGIEDDAAAGTSMAAPNVTMRSARRLPEKTIKQAVVEILTENMGGLTAQEILAKIIQKYGVNYPRSSLSPQLSRLKSEKIILLDGNVWRLDLGTLGQKNWEASAVSLEKVIEATQRALALGPEKGGGT